MSCIPRPTPLPNPEASLVKSTSGWPGLARYSSRPSIDSQTWLFNSEKEKHQSLNSLSSQGSLAYSYLPSLSRTPTPYGGPLPPIAHGKPISTSFGASTPGTPVSAYSRASSPMSSIRSARSPYHAQSPGTPPKFLTQARATRALPLAPLPNPIGDPVPRHDSPMSILSAGSSHSEGHGYGYGQRRNMLMGLEPTLSFGSLSPYPGTNPPLGAANIPLSMRPSMRGNIPFREQAPSPAHSMSASLHVPSIASPLPTAISGAIRGLPSSPRLAVPQKMPLYPAHHGGICNEMRRSRSVPNFHVTVPRRALSATAQPADRPPGAPDWVSRKVSRPVDFRQWRQNVLEAAEQRNV